jgi:hypothetical protein
MNLQKTAKTDTLIFLRSCTNGIAVNTKNICRLRFGLDLLTFDQIEKMDALVSLCVRAYSQQVVKASEALANYRQGCTHIFE